MQAEQVRSFIEDRFTGPLGKLKVSQSLIALQLIFFSALHCTYGQGGTLGTLGIRLGAMGRIDHMGRTSCWRRIRVPYTAHSKM